MNGNALLPEIKKFSLWNHLRCSMQIRKKVSIPVRRTELELILRLVFCLNGCLNLVNAHGSVLHGFWMSKQIVNKFHICGIGQATEYGLSHEFYIILFDILNIHSTRHG